MCGPMARAGPMREEATSAVFLATEPPGGPCVQALPGLDESLQPNSPRTLEDLLTLVSLPAHANDSRIYAQSRFWS